MKHFSRAIILSFCLLSISGVIIQLRAQSITGKWKGAIQVNGQELKIIAHFKQNSNIYQGTIDITQQMAQGIALQNLKISKDSIHYEFPAGLGRAIFNGKRIDADSIKGTFTQSSQSFPFYLRKTKEEAPGKTENNQSYKNVDLIIKHDSLKIGGTLSLPKKGNKFPLLILISGSGTQNRNEDIFGFKPFKQIADTLSSKGIAVFRYDDRGIGKSTGNLEDVTIQGLAEDVKVIVNHLEKRSDINKHKIGLLGHSEGGDVAVNLAANDPQIAFLVLMSAPAYPGSDIIIQQIKMLNSKMGVPDSKMQESLKMEKKVIKVVRANKGWSRLRKELKNRLVQQLNNLPESQKKQISNIPSYADQQVNAQIKQIKTSHFRSFVTYNPGTDLKKLNIPVLAFFGGLDTQVNPKKNKNRMKQYLGQSRAKYKIEMIPNANHLYQKAKTGLPTEYGSLEPRFVPGFLDSLNTWLQQNVVD